MQKKNLLIIDDEKLIYGSLSKQFLKDGFDVRHSFEGKKALKMIERKQPDIVLLDYNLRDTNGLEIIKKIKDINEDIIIIMMSANGNIDTAVEAVNQQVFDFIKKPFVYDEIKLKVDKALNSQKLNREVFKLRIKSNDKNGLGNIIGKSSSMRHVCNLIRKVAKSDATTVLISGESGTGKDLVAKAIHHESKRSNCPFMAINCASLPETLLESELFGHEKGAFTDAKILKKGLFELANKGTILLDEIGDAKYSTQVKLLRFIEEKSFKRVGGVNNISVDIRIIAATNQDLTTAVNKGQFRKDLFFRLNVIPIVIDPLRERKEDIPLLIDYYVNQFNSEFKRKVKKICNEALEILINYSWPGNVRELRNVVERIMILDDKEEITKDDLPLELLLNKEIEDQGYLINFHIPEEGLAMHIVEKSLLKKALNMTNGNQTRAAKLLKISRHALRYKMKKFDLF